MIGREESKRTWCPYQCDEIGCVGSECAMWRWLPLTTDEPGYVAAVKSAIGTKPEGHEKPLTVNTAPKWVNENRAELGLRTVPYLGYCGLAGKPEA